MLTKKILTAFLAACLFVSQAWATATLYDGSTTRIVVTSVSDIEATAFTIGCWTNRNGEGENGTGRILVKDGSGGTGWRIQNGGSASHEYSFTASWSSSDGVWTTTGVRPSTSVWSHVAVSYDGSSSSNNPVIYFDAVSQSIAFGTSPSGTWSAGTGNLIIGDRAASDRSWDGKLADCFYYNRILTVSEINQIMKRGPASLKNGLIGYWPLGAFSGNNYTPTSGLGGSVTGASTDSSGPPVNCPQGGMCD